MKYAVSTDNITTEFSSYDEAEAYILSVGLPSGSIFEVSEDPEAYEPSCFEIYQQKIEAGYPVPNTPYSLALGDSDRMQFSGMLVLIRELMDAGYITGDTTQSIKDKDDNILEMTTTEFRQLMIGYGVYYKQIWDECAPES